MSGSRWVITPSLLSRSLIFFLYNYSTYSCHLFLISSACVRSIPCVLNCARLCVKCSLGIYNFLEISSHSHSTVFLYFFSLITEKGFLISLCYSSELCIQMGVSFLSPLLLASLLFTAICKASSESHFAFLPFFFLGMVLIPVSCTMSWTSIHSSSGTLSIRSGHLNLSLTSTV